jgi:2'-5' RNA ligase
MQLHKQIFLRKYSILLNSAINRFINFFSVIILLLSISITQVLAIESSNIKEYGIVVLLEEKCTKEAEKLNINISQVLSHLQNVKNYWHVTLYHGAYEINSLDEIYNKLQELQLRPFTLNLTKIYSTADRWIDLGIEKTEYLQNLHTSVVLLASPYHKRPLVRSTDIYKDMTSSQREQVDNYGVSGILTMYNPHMTLFYQYPPSFELQQTAIKIGNNFTNIVCKASKIALGELGYNGNIEKIIYSINIPN